MENERKKKERMPKGAAEAQKQKSKQNKQIQQAKQKKKKVISTDVDDWIVIAQERHSANLESKEANENNTNTQKTEGNEQKQLPPAPPPSLPLQSPDASSSLPLVIPAPLNDEPQVAPQPLEDEKESESKREQQNKSQNENTQNASKSGDQESEQPTKCAEEPSALNPKKVAPNPPPSTSDSLPTSSSNLSSSSSSQQAPSASTASQSSSSSSSRSTPTPLLCLILRDTFAHLTAKMRALRVVDGSCALVAVVTPTNVYLASAGDCRAVLVSRWINGEECVANMEEVLHSGVEEGEIVKNEKENTEESFNSKSDTCKASPAREDKNTNENTSICLHSEKLSESTSKQPSSIDTEEHKHNSSDCTQREELFRPFNTFCPTLRRLPTNFTQNGVNNKQSRSSRSSKQQAKDEHSGLFASGARFTSVPSVSSSLRHPLIFPPPSFFLTARALTIDHKPLCPRERRFIKRVGGFVTTERRINSILAVARALGDFDLSPAVSSEPDVTMCAIERWGKLHVDGSDCIQCDCAEHAKERNCNSLAPRSHGCHSLEGSPSTDSSSSTPLQSARSSLKSQSIHLSSSHASSYVSPYVPPSLAPVLDEWLIPPQPFPALFHAREENWRLKELSAHERASYSEHHSKEDGNNTVSSASSSTSDSLSVVTASTSSAPHNSSNVFVNGWKREDMALVLACDGLYDVIDTQQVAEIGFPWMDEEAGWSVFSDPVFDEEDDDEGKGGEEDTTCEENDSSTEGGQKAENEEICSQIPADAQEEPATMAAASSQLSLSECAVGTLNEQKAAKTEHTPISKKKCHRLRSLKRSQSNVSSTRTHHHSHKGCRCSTISKGQLAELAALRLRSAAEALESTDNISIIVIML